MRIGLTFTTGARKTAIGTFEHRTEDGQVKGGTLQEGSPDKDFKGLPECGLGMEFQLAHFHEDFADGAGEDVFLLGGGRQGLDDVLDEGMFMHLSIISHVALVVSGQW